VYLLSCSQNLGGCVYFIAGSLKGDLGTVKTYHVDPAGKMIADTFTVRYLTDWCRAHVDDSLQSSNSGISSRRPAKEHFLSV
jgi:hypothetical protein